jgi:hypothetical protein
VDRIAHILPTMWSSHEMLNVKANPYYCGYTKQKFCERPQDTASFCKWSFDNQQCLYKHRCQKPKNMCGIHSEVFQPDLCCTWNEVRKECEVIDSQNVPAECAF